MPNATATKAKDTPKATATPDVEREANTGANTPIPADGNSRGTAAYADVNALTFLDESDLPVPADGRSSRYFDLLNAVKTACEANPSNIGKWVPIAKFATNQGANMVAKNLRGEGKRPANLPPGRFVFKTGKYERGDGKGKGSQLYVSYQGE